MKYWQFCAVTFSIIMLITGCGNKQEINKQEPAEIPVQETDLYKDHDKNDSNALNPESSNKETENKKTDLENTNNLEPENENALTKEELSYYTEYLNNLANNGFLTCTYDDIRDVSLNELFHTGAGMEMVSNPPREEVVQAFLKAEGEEELYTDFKYLTTEQINRYLIQKTGYDLKQMRNTLDYTYLEKYDLYAFEHGDTNAVTCECLDGMETKEGHILLEYKDIYFPVNRFRVTLKKEGNRLYFVRNERLAYSIEDMEVFDNSLITQFKTDADTDFIKDFTYKGNYEDITKENLKGIWYDPKSGESFVLAEKGSLVYIPYLNFYGNNRYEWEIEDRSDRGLCPALKIYTLGKDKGPLTYYINGVTDEVFWSNTQSQIFYRQNSESD